ncbi:MAG: carboxyl transferase domain-containing protein, partial [Spirochaetota bacterium]
AGRAMLDSIIDIRTPRILLILRNAYGGAYASFNNYPTGADLVLALPTARLAVMGPAGKEYVYKEELRKLRDASTERARRGVTERVASGDAAEAACKDAEDEAAQWLKAQEAQLNLRYEKELMNPREALSLGSISSLVMPTDLRKVLGENMGFFLRHYRPSPLSGVHREFF